MLPKLIILVACIALSTAKILPKQLRQAGDNEVTSGEKGSDGKTGHSGQSGHSGDGQPGHSGQSGQSGQEQPGQSGQSGQQGHTEKPGQGGKHGHTEKPGQSGQHGQTEKPGQGGQHEQTEKPGQGGQHGQTEKPGQGEYSGPSKQGNLVQDVLQSLLYVPLTDSKGTIQGYYTSIPDDFFSRFHVRNQRELLDKLREKGILPVTNYSGALLGFFSGVIGGSDQQKYDVTTLIVGLYPHGLFPLLNVQGQVVAIFSRYPFVNVGVQVQPAEQQEQPVFV